MVTSTTSAWVEFNGILVEITIEAVDLVVGFGSPSMLELVESLNLISLKIETWIIIKLICLDGSIRIFWIHGYDLGLGWYLQIELLFVFSKGKLSVLGSEFFILLKIDVEFSGNVTVSKFLGLI